MRRRGERPSVRFYRFPWRDTRLSQTSQTPFNVVGRRLIVIIAKLGPLSRLYGIQSSSKTLTMPTP